MNEVEQKLAAMTNEELHEELALEADDVSEELWAEVGFRLGVNGGHGVRVGTRGPTEAAQRLERYRAMWATLDGGIDP